MRKLLVVPMAIVFLCMSACTCNTQKQTVEQVQKNIKTIQTSHMRYINADTTLDADAKEDWELQYGATDRALNTLHKQSKGE